MDKIDVSVIVPCRNVARFIDECLESVLNQNFVNISIEISIFDDSSEDDTLNLVKSYEEKFVKRQINFLLDGQLSGHANGVGYAKNAAVRRSSGRYLCFLDADDVMYSNRIQSQYETAEKFDDLTLLGSKFVRIPVDSTIRYAKWANNLTNYQLKTQIFTSNGPTLVAPTWFCSRKLFNQVGGYSELESKGFPEDLDFFYKALRLGADLHRVDEELVLYRYHAACASFSVSETTILNIRVAEFERQVLVHWNNFVIWNAGKQGKTFYKCLNEENKLKVSAFCDVDVKKISHGNYEFYERLNGKLKVGRRVPIISYKDVQPPVVICVKLDLTNGQFERLIKEKCWLEGRDYYYLS